MNVFSNSLKARYIISAIALAIVIILVAYWGNYNVANTQRDASANLEVRKQLVDFSRQIRVNLFNGYQSLDVFLLEPELEKYREQAEDHIEEAINITSALREHPWVITYSKQEIIDQLTTSLMALKRETRILFDTRKDTNRQYPSLAVGAVIMQPNRNRFNNAIALAIYEVNEEDTITSDPEVYKGVERVRHLWTQVLSNFRLYLANRVGSFNEAVLPVQENGIKTMFGELQEKLKNLKDMGKEDRLGFETGPAVDEMLDASQQWFEGFKRVQEIHHSGEWRIDSKIMQEKVAPLVAHISSTLETLENQIGNLVVDDINLISQVASQQSMIVWLIAGFGLLFILLIIFSLESMVFRPIASVASALKAEAFGKKVIELPNERSKETQYLVEAFSEMSKQVHNRQAELEYQATHDALTSLPNRVLLQDRIQHDITLAHRTNKSLALLVIDLDRFKEVNDTLGHHVGDKLLIEIGARFQSVLREIDTVARLGGDEFAILLPDTTESNAIKITQKLTQALDIVFSIETLQLYINASIGIAVYPEHGTDAASLLKHADIAMYVSKKDKMDYCLYDPSKDEHSIRDLAMVTELREALERNQLSLEYQPKMDMNTGQVLGVEALLRWYDSSFGTVPPLKIIEIAEQTGLIQPLTNWVIDQALLQCAAWKGSGIELPVSINLSVHNLQDPGLVDSIHSKLGEYELSTSSLCFEITESAMMSNPVLGIEVLSRLNEMGVRLAIDDFGTGFSSLAYLKQLPVHELKIDKSFVFNIVTNDDDRIIVNSTIDLAHNLGLQVVAEGIETQEVWGALIEMNCNIAQGYYLSKPLDPGSLERWLAKQPNL